MAYFSAIQPCPTILIESQEYFVKQSYRNRCYINTEHGSHALIIPVTEKGAKTAVTKVKIDYTQKWLNNHWRTIQSAYGKAPFFEYYADDLHDVLFTRHSYLYELNLRLLTMCLGWLKWTKELKETESFEKEYPAEIYDLRSCINPKDEAGWSRVYNPVVYQQVFGNSFVANLSIVDVIFCCGPEASRILKSSRSVS